MSKQATYISKILKEIDDEILDIELSDLISCKSMCFCQSSYLRWAFKEIRDIIVQNKDENIYMILQEMAEQCDDKSASSKTLDSCYIFSVLYDTILYVLDIAFRISEEDSKC